MGRIAMLCLAVLVAELLEGADPLYLSAQQKLDRLLAGAEPPGATVVFTAAELNGYARVKVPEVVPEGIRDPRVQLGAGVADAYATVDFLKMRQARGAPTNRLLALMIEGERPLKVSLRVASAAGRATVYLTRVEISGAAAQGALLDFLIRNFFLPLYPDAKINEPFDLESHIERIDLQPAGIRVFVKK